MNQLEEIIECFRKGDYQRFPSFYEATHKKIYFIAYGLVGNKEEAEDVSQETYTRFISRLSSYQKGTNPYAYLATIARNIAYDLLRKRDNTPLSYEEEIGGEEEKSTSSMKEISRYLEKLSPLEREIIILHVLEDMKFKDVAKVVGKSLSATLVCYHRAMKKLRKEEEDEEE